MPEENTQDLETRLTALEVEMRMFRETVLPMLGEIRQRLLMRNEG